MTALLVRGSPDYGRDSHVHGRGAFFQFAGLLVDLWHATQCYLDHRICSIFVLYVSCARDEYCQKRE